MSQSDLDDLVRDLNLVKGSSQLLGSRLKEMKFLAEGTTFSWYRHRELQIRELLSDQDFKSKMNSVEKYDGNFLGNNKSEESQDIVRNMTKTYKALGSRMSVKIHFLNLYFCHFSANLGVFSEEQGERFHQDISEMKTRYQGRWNETMMADYCWCLKRHNPTASHNRKLRKRTFEHV